MLPISYLISFFLLWSSSLAQEGDETPSIEVPPPLTDANFDTVTSKNLHVIEFFSPYCHHCKNLAPVWESTYVDFFEESKSLNISFHQVNCVESGDLCTREDIRFYPCIRLYGPDGFIKAYPSNYKKREEDFIKFARQEAMDSNNLDLLKLESKSELVNDEQLFRLLMEPQDEPVLVSFWPSSDFSNMNEPYSFDHCSDCFSHQRVWRAVSNKLLSKEIKSVHFNCQNPTENSKNSVICREMAFTGLLEGKDSRFDTLPRYAVILPNRKSGNVIKYPFGSEYASLDSLVDFAFRAVENSQPKLITSDQIMNFISEDFDPIKDSLKNEEIMMVFKYDEKTSVEEDFQYLEQLIEPLLKIPNVRLFKSTDDLIALNKKIYEELYQKFNVDPPLPINEEFFIINSFTQSPTFFLYKRKNYLPNVFPGYSTTETRNLDTILQWLKMDAAPLLNELSPDNYERLVHFNDEYFEKMVIQLVDTKNEKFKEGSRKLLESLTIAAHQFEILRNQNLYDDLLSERLDKKTYVESLKASNSPSTEIIQALQKEIYYKYNHRVLFTYLDMKKYSKLLVDRGFTVNDRDYKTGDIIVAEKGSNKFYYERDRNGEYIDQNSLPYVLSALNFPNKYPLMKMRRTLLKSPFSSSFRFMDQIHQFGVLGYSTLVAVFYLLFKCPNAIRNYRIKKRYLSKRDTQGLLGKKGKQG